MADYITKESVHTMVRHLTKFAWASPINSERRITVDTDDVHFGIDKIPAADVAPVVHERCPICSGRKILTQDCYNDYSVEIDAEQGEMSIWQGDACLTVISIDYCPNCGAKMDGGAEHEDD